MNYLILLIGLLLISACGPQSNEAPYPYSAPENKSVLIIGDSISYGYTPFVVSGMPDYEITHIPENARNSFYTSQNIDRWLDLYPEGFGTILWNNGMWNCIHGKSPEPGHPADQPLENLFTSLEDYEADLRVTASRLSRTGSRVIFLTTTFIPNNSQGGILEVGYERELNEIAKRVLPEYGIEVFDIHPLSESLPASSRMYGYDIHYTDEGSAALSEFVINALKNRRLK